MAIGDDGIPDLSYGLGALHHDVVMGMRAAGYVADGPFARCDELVAELALDASSDRVYGAIVELSQDFRTRYPLIVGEGNFGSIDDDPPASPRYTECRLSAAGMAAADGRLPNLLVNGAHGPGVSIPPHNLGEVTAAALALLDDPELSEADLLEIVPGPDYPTGGRIPDPRALASLNRTGRGTFVLEGSVHVEPPPRSRPSPTRWAGRARDALRGGSYFNGMATDESRGPRLVVTELPYGVQKGGDGGLIERIADLVHRSRLPEFGDLADESYRAGMRLVLGLWDDADPDEALNRLFEETDLRITVNAELTVRVGGAARTLTLRDLVSAHIEHRRAALGAAGDDRLRRELLDLAAALPSARRTLVG